MLLINECGPKLALARLLEVGSTILLYTAASTNGAKHIGSSIFFLEKNAAKANRTDRGALARISQTLSSTS